MRLADLGPPSELRRHAPAVAAEALAFDEVLLSGIDQAALVPEAAHPEGRGADALLERVRDAGVVLEYPLVEGEIVRQRRPQLVRVALDQATGRHALAGVLRWPRYAAAPIVLDGAVIGLIHATRDTMDERDADALAAFAVCFGVVYERAVLRRRLRVQRQELREIAQWADARTSELGQGLVTLGAEAEAEPAAGPQPSGSGGEAALRDLLTRRELDVIRSIVRGATNADIARELVLSEGTVKFHVKNILRKMGASNRAEATSHYLRLMLNRPDRP